MKRRTGLTLLALVWMVPSCRAEEPPPAAPPAAEAPENGDEGFPRKNGHSDTANAVWGEKAPVPLFSFVSRYFAILVTETRPEVPLRLTLHVKNEEGKPLFYQGQPITISVALVDQRLHLKPPVHEKEEPQEKEQIERFTVGTKEWPWFNGLALRIERIVKNTKGSTGREPVLEELDWKKQMIIPRPGGYVGNEPGYDALIVVFELDLNTSQSLEPGQYIVKVVWDSTNAPADAMRVWHGRLEADEEVAMEIVVAKTPEERGKVAYTRAIIYMRNKDYENTIEAGA